MKKKYAKKKLKTMIIVVLIMIICCIGILFYLGKNTSKTSNNKNVEKLNKNQLAVKINAVLYFKNYVSINPGIENPSNNNYDIIVTMYINNKKIYESNKISPGEKIDELKINKKLIKGKYNAIAYFNAYDKKGNYKGKSGVEIKLNIE